MTSRPRTAVAALALAAAALLAGCGDDDGGTVRDIGDNGSDSGSVSGSGSGSHTGSGSEPATTTTAP